MIAGGDSTVYDNVWMGNWVYSVEPQRTLWKISVNLLDGAHLIFNSEVFTV
jgi:hypothetical protein